MVHCRVVKWRGKRQLKSDGQGRPPTRLCAGRRNRTARTQTETPLKGEPSETGTTNVVDLTDSLAERVVNPKPRRSAEDGICSTAVTAKKSAARPRPKGGHRNVQCLNSLVGHRTYVSLNCEHRDFAAGLGLMLV